MTKPVLAILGGQGPLATSRFLNLLNTTWIKYGAVQDSDFLSTLTLSFESNLDSLGSWSGQKEEERFLDANLSVINHSPATHVVMPCNTMHLNEEYIRAHLAYGKEFISLPEVLIEEVQKRNIGNVEIWVSQQAREENLYEPLISSGSIYAPNQSEVNKAILSGMTGSLLSYVSMLERMRKSRDKRTFLFACTDLSVHAERFRQTGLTVLDSLEILSNHIWENLA